MSVSFEPQDELRASRSLPEIRDGTAFVSGIGRVYHLFGNEGETFSIPAIPPRLAATTRPALSLEEALQQIESYSAPAVSENVLQPKAEPPVLQRFQVLGEFTSPPSKKMDEGGSRPFSGSSRTGNQQSTCEKRTQPDVMLSVKDIVEEVSQHLPNLNEERRKPLRVLSESIEEPFIVPFTKPEPSPEVVETNNIRTLKVMTEVVPQVLVPKNFPKYWQRHRTKPPPYRKQCSLPPLSDPPTEEPVVIDESKPDIDVSTFQWSTQLDSLMQTANRQAQMLTDHLVVQSNQGVKTICFKSVFPGDGCSTILLCAVRALTERKHRVLLVDAHHRHIDLPKQFNLTGNLDSGNAAIVLNEYLGLWVWQESKTVEENTALLAEVIAAHHNQYDLILLDCGSLTESPLPELVEFWNRIRSNGIILVSNMKHPPEIPMSHIAGRLRQHQIHLIGIAENYV